MAFLTGSVAASPPDERSEVSYLFPFGATTIEEGKA
jgi:hypothetical protein